MGKNGLGLGREDVVETGVRGKVGKNGLGLGTRLRECAARRPPRCNTAAPPAQPCREKLHQQVLRRLRPLCRTHRAHRRILLARGGQQDAQQRGMALGRTARSSSAKVNDVGARCSEGWAARRSAEGNGVGARCSEGWAARRSAEGDGVGARCTAAPSWCTARPPLVVQLIRKVLTGLSWSRRDTSHFR